MSAMFYVDIPTNSTLYDAEGPWENVASFDTKQEAVDFIREHIGPCDDDGKVSLIAEGDDGEDERDCTCANYSWYGEGHCSACPCAG
jgi:hypothetical protein